MRNLEIPTLVCLFFATSVASTACSKRQTVGSEEILTQESDAGSASAAREGASVSSESSIAGAKGATSADSTLKDTGASGRPKTGPEQTTVGSSDALPARQLEPVEICSLPEGVPIGLVRFDGNRIGYGCSVPIPPIGFFEKFYSIDLETKDTKKVEREQFYTLTTPDQKVGLKWEESFGFTYVADGDKLKKVEFSNSKIMCRNVPEDWHEIASYSKKVESAALAPDGTTVLVSMDGKVDCVTPSGESRVVLSSEGIHYGQPAFGGTSDRFYVKSVHAEAGDVAVLACDLKSGKTSTVLRAKNLLGFSVSPDGAFLAYLESSAPTKRIRILVLAKKKVVAEIEHEQSNVVSNPLLIFSHDSSAIYFGKHGAKGGTLFRVDVK